MSTSILEIVELSDGEVVLQRAEGDGGPLVSIRFSEESQLHLKGHALEVARAMIQGGIQAAAELAEQGEMDVEDIPAGVARVLH